MLRFSQHASERLNGRLSGIVTAAEVERAVRKVGSFGVGETAVCVRRLPRVLKVTADDGSVSTGDTVWFVYRRSCPTDFGVVTTVELRGSWQGNAARWTKVINLA